MQKIHEGSRFAKLQSDNGSRPKSNFYRPNSISPLSAHTKNLRVFALTAQVKGPGVRLVVGRMQVAEEGWRIGSGTLQMLMREKQHKKHENLLMVGERKNRQPTTKNREIRPSDDHITWLG
jgi:hypothetical protein